MSKQTIGEFLATLRKDRGLKQQEVADKLGISNKTLSSWESGRSYPDILTLPALAELYGVTADEILNGERLGNTSEHKEAGEISETSQKKLLKNAANRYSVKCTTLVGIGIGGIGLFLFAFLMGSFAEWPSILLTMLSAVIEVAVIILFVVFEKSALLIEEERSRYSLTIKRMTFRAAFKIVCAICVAILCVIIAVQVITSGNFLPFSGRTLPLLLLVVPPIVLLVWLSRRGREFYTDEDSAAAAHNNKLALKLLLIGGAISIVLLVVTTVLSGVSFSHTEKRAALPKDDFIRLLQTVEISAHDAENYGIEAVGERETRTYFVDVKAALSNPIERDLVEKRGTLYHVEGDLYFRYTIDEEISRCYVSYIPDLSEPFEVDVISGNVLFRENGQSKYYGATAENLISGIENEEVFFSLTNSLAVVSSVSYGFGYRRNYAENYIEVSDDSYTHLLKIAMSFPIIALIGFVGIIITVVVCLCLYFKRRTPILP